jgi:hypothetical protein
MSMSLLACDATEVAAPDPMPMAVGHCLYSNPFSQAQECKEYTGSAWSEARAKNECRAAEPLGVEGVFAAGPCLAEARYGRCEVEDGNDSYGLVFAGEDAEACGTTLAGCETFVGGVFVPGNTCSGATENPNPTPSTGAFVPPYESCEAPKDSTPGLSQGGEVCTQVLVSGCTEPGRRFDDYGSCEDVFTQRPFFPYPVSDRAPPDLSRLNDAAFVDDLAWAKAQVGACACVCCHSELGNGTRSASWNIDSDPIWTDTLTDSGLAMLAGLVESGAFGAFAPEDNNGFSRSDTGIPTTDAPRMQAFLRTEYSRRGLTEADATQWPPFGGPLVLQADYVPEVCGEGEGLDSQGSLQWSGGEARYIYVLQAGAKNPGVPPNRDLPEGTIWRLDVPLQAQTIASPLAYGAVPQGAMQQLPKDAMPIELLVGETYYLYVLADVGVPLTRCLFTP